MDAARASRGLRYASGFLINDPANRQAESIAPRPIEFTPPGFVFFWLTFPLSREALARIMSSAESARAGC